jgi:putative glutamine amidotransferase
MRKPLIGIAYSDAAVRDNEMRMRTYVSRKYYQALQSAGAEVILLPPVECEESCRRYLDIIDGLLLPGGEDVDPRFQNEEPAVKLGMINPFRDKYELMLAKMAFESSTPTLGICRGVQVMAIALGGAVYQDISEVQSVKHSQEAPRWATSHKVSIDPSSKLASWLKSNEVFTNSFHHQAVKKVPEGTRQVAAAGDGICEAIESCDSRLFVGVQWHPEETRVSDQASKCLFESFVGEIIKTFC